MSFLEDFVIKQSPVFTVATLGGGEQVTEGQQRRARLMDLLDQRCRLRADMPTQSKQASARTMVRQASKGLSLAQNRSVAHKAEKIIVSVKFLYDYNNYILGDMDSAGHQLILNVEAVRKFNRFYRQQIRVLNEGWQQSQFSLTEVGVLYEIAHGRTSAKEIVRELGLDGGYLSRILRGFQARGLILRTRSRQDRRQDILELTARGQSTFRILDEHSSQQMASMLDKLSVDERNRLLSAMATIEEVLGPAKESSKTPFYLRSPRPDPE